MSILDNFNSWKEFLSSRVDAAENSGMNESMMTNMAKHVGDYLSSHIEPANKEEQVLKELWEAASPEEQKAIASTMIKLVQK